MLSLPHQDTVSAERNGWIDVVAPTQAEIERLESTFSIPPRLLAHALDPDERTHLKSEAGVTLVVLQVPVALAGGAAVPYATQPIGIIMAGDFIATVSRTDNEVIRRLREFAASEWPERAHHRLVLHALDIAAEAYLTHLRAIGQKCDALEESLGGSLGNDEVLQLLRYQKSLLYFGTALRSYVPLLERLQHSPGFVIPAEDRDMLEDVLVEIRQALDIATVSGNILGEMMDAFASIISNNLNIVMKHLAAAMILLALPPIVSGFYGMNVPLYGQSSPWALASLLGVSLLILTLAALLLRRRRWI